MLNASNPLATQLFNYGTQQMNYMLGDCGRSWVVGFGTNYPLLPYHKSSYNSYLTYPTRGRTEDEQMDDFLYSTTPNRFILYGALVGGPFPNDSWVDSRWNYEWTEVTQDYNAGFTGAVAGLVARYGGVPFTDDTLDLGWTFPGAGTLMNC
jgi:endoglucanase